MATPITHIVLTEKVFNSSFAGYEKSAFFAGTSFPDIRYLGGIERDETHYEGVTMQDVHDQPSSFMAGVYFHSLLDERRQKYIEENCILDAFADSPYAIRALYFFEDQMLYERIDNRSVYTDYFATIYADTQAYGLGDEMLQKRYRGLQHYMQCKPDSVIIDGFIRTAGQSHEVASEILKLTEQMHESDAFIAYVNDLYDKFPRLIV